MARTEWSERLGGDVVSFLAWLYDGSVTVRMLRRGRVEIASAAVDAARSLDVQAHALAGRISARYAG